jgi:hypothetical protein
MRLRRATESVDEQRLLRADRYRLPKKLDEEVARLIWKRSA